MSLNMVLKSAPLKMSSWLYAPLMPAWPNLSYWDFLLSSLRMAYASLISLNFSSAPSSLFLSGWNSKASFLKAFFISSAEALLSTPRTS